MVQDAPTAYFITFSCYGARLHGSNKGSVDKYHNVYNTPSLSANVRRHKKSSYRMQNIAYLLDAKKRDISLTAIMEICANNGWRLYAAHVRSNHVHLLLTADESAEHVMVKTKRAISKALNIKFPQEAALKKWTRHGSTKYIWRNCMLSPVMHYIIEEQGEKMACYAMPGYFDATSGEF